MQGRNNQNRNQILAKSLFSSWKVNKCQFKVYTFIFWICLYTSRPRRFPVTGRLVGALPKILSFIPLARDVCILMKKTHSLSPQLLFACFFSLESSHHVLSLVFCLLLPPSLLDFQMFQHRQRQTLSTWGVHRNAAINSEINTAYGLPPIVEAMVRLRATLTSRGYFQHVPRETCWSKIYGWSFDSAFFAVNFFFRRCCLSDTRRNVFWCKGAFAQMPSTREEIRFHMKERDPPGYHFGRAVGRAIPSVFGRFRGPCYHQVGPVSRTALISAQEKNVLGSTEVVHLWSRCTRDISRFSSSTPLPLGRVAT